MNLKALEPDKYIRVVVAVVYEDNERREVKAREVGTNKEVVRFLRKGMEEGALMGEIVWVLEETEDYVVEKRVAIHWR